ncbi:hypothetical protein [Desulfobacter latus]|uniref:Uncharacterized protein n=1 Tax=Desulfobacter latus TaxID=2292 RepID=A0A850TB04_9BACT|nr:hypothetical protein [Desulfobacter latus]NWH06802.1 hypothetical protein [Desulfobacter latus]
MPNPASMVLKGLRVAGGKTLLRFAGWAGVAVAVGELGWFTAKKGKILERFTHYYCEEGKVTCGKMIPDDLVERALEDPGTQNIAVEVKCPHCPRGKRTVKSEEWHKMKANREKWI